MALQSPQSLMSELGWPPGQLGQCGSLIWSEPLNEKTVVTAAVLVSEKLLTLRYRLATVGAGIRTPLEAKWSLDEGPFAFLTCYRENGKDMPLDPSKALLVFQTLQGMLKSSPVFQAQGRRVPAIDQETVFPNY